MKKSLSLRKQLFGLMALLVLLQSLSLTCALFISRVFFMLDAEAFRLLTSATSNRAQSYNAEVGQLVGNVAQAAQRLSAQLNRLSYHGQPVGDQLYLDDTLYLEAAMIGSKALVDILDGNMVSGAFVFLDGSNANKKNPDAHSAIYIRNSAPSTQASNDGKLLLELGPISVSQNLNISTSVHWNLDMAMDHSDRSIYDFYYKPIEATRTIVSAEIERYGYWSPPTDVFDDGQQDVIFSLPLLDNDGNPFGVIGIEISTTLFNQHYLPNEELPYADSFLAIVPSNDHLVMLDWYIPSGPIAQVYLNQEQRLTLAEVSGSDLHQTTLQGLGDMYCCIQPLNIYSQNSPFYDEGWSIISFAPQDVLHETSSGIRVSLIVSIAGTTLVSFASIFLLVYITTRKIKGLSADIQGLSAVNPDLHFEKTRIREIDELTSAVEALNKKVISASKTTSKILEMTLLPIGGYEISYSLQQVTLTGYIHTLLFIPPGANIALDEWVAYEKVIKAMPTQEDKDIYQYTVDGVVKWLRIHEALTPSGRIGVIVDVSKDVEERRRLAYELDYDSLTHLYNRVAFRREAQNLIEKDPEKVGIMVFADLDNLKYINDTFGHSMGDRLLMRAGDMFRTFEAKGGIVARASGDEFSIYLHGFDTKEDAKKCLYDHIAELEDYNLETKDGGTQKIRFSSGITFYPDDSDQVAELIKLADFAMYEAKHNQKGAIYEFNRETYQNKVYLLDNREAINRLLDEGLIRFAFQPIVDMKTGEIWAYEALMRPLLDNFKSPLEILAVAESQYKLAQLERLVIMTAFQYVADHIDELGQTKIFINSIPSQILSDADHDMLIRRYGDIFQNIVIEITESECDWIKRLEKKTEYVLANNMGLAMDDYGSGYSNEVRVMAMRPHIIKIDIALISGIDVSPDKQVLVSNMIKFCHAKGIKVVAEGVETSSELATLATMDVDFVQGYYLLRPGFDFGSIPADIVQEIRDLNKNLGS